MRANVGGVVLCGGKSSRMGRPKAWLPFGDELMLPRVVRILQEVVRPVVVVASPGQDLPSLPSGVEIVRDAIEGRGPLQGLAAGLEALREKADAAFVSSCDVPLLKPAFIEKMLDLLGENAIAVPFLEEHYHPLSAVYRVAVLPQVRELLATNSLGPRSLFERVPTRFVNAAEVIAVDPDFQSLRNVNTPEEYEFALKSLPRP